MIWKVAAAAATAAAAAGMRFRRDQVIVQSRAKRLGEKRWKCSVVAGARTA
jgi:hypothetical protein